MLKKTIKEHKRIIFNGNNYSDEWIDEAERRGLYNLKSTPEAIPYFASEKSVELFARHGIYTEAELCSRCEILFENYSKILNIEALTMSDMIKKDIIPAVSAYTQKLAETALAKKAVSDRINVSVEQQLAEKLSELTYRLYESNGKLENSLLEVKKYESDIETYARFYHDVVFANMKEAREIADEMEVNTAHNFWPFPTYSELMFNV